MGGLIILVGVFVGLPLLTNGPLVWFGPNNNLAVGVLVLLFALIGFIDDFVVPRLMPGKRGLGWKQKICMQVLAALIPMLMLGLGSQPMMLGLAVFLILFFGNAYNFADGLDGLAGTILVGQIVGILGLGLVRYGHVPHEFGVLVALLGGVLAFLLWNAPRAKVFMGDVGSLPIGAVLGAIWFVVPESFRDGRLPSDLAPRLNSLSWVVAVSVWSIPMICELVPVPLQVFSVKVFKKKLFPFTPIHHAFEEIKLKTGETEESESYKERVKTSPRWAHWPETRIVFTFAIFQLLCSMLAITVALMTKLN